MSVYKDKVTKKWFYEFSYKTSLGETKRRKKHGFNLKSEAQEAERIEMIKLKETPPSAITFKQLYKRYLEFKTPEWIDSTHRKFETIIDLHILPHFESMSLDKVTTRDIENWKTTMYSKLTPDGIKYKAITLNRFRRELSALFNYAVKHQYIKFNPVHATTSFKDPGQIIEMEKEIWTPQEFQKFILEVDNEKWKLFFTFLWVTGVRIGEAQGVHFRDIDFDNKTVTISKSINTKKKGVLYIVNPTKTKKVRIIELPDDFLNELKPYYEEQEKIIDWNGSRFLFGFNKPLPNTTIDKERIKYISSHCFRHSHASLLLASGIDIKSVSERLGHKDVVETLNTYAHVLPSNREKIIEIIKNSMKTPPK